MDTKSCSKCKQEKSKSEFSPRKSRCKQCTNSDNRAVYAYNKLGVSDAELLAISRYEQKHSATKQCRYCKRVKPKEKFLKRQEGLDGYRNICLTCHYEEQRPRERNWRRNNCNQRLSKYVSHRMWKSLKGKKDGIHWEKLVGYSLEELKVHLENKFQESMTWENYGKWHIDHIQPVSSFTITSYSCAGFKACWALSNLQPLWDIDNKRKYNKCLPLEKS